MSATHPGIKADESPVEDVAPTETGDAYDEDTGEYLATLNLTNGLPAQISVFHEGYWYVFKPNGRYKDEEVKKPITAEMIELAADLDKTSGIANPK